RSARSRSAPCPSGERSAASPRRRACTRGSPRASTGSTSASASGSTFVVDAKSTRGLSWAIASTRLTTERADERRQQLVASALEVFGDRDYDEVSVDEVAEAAGVSHGLVFQYFGSKKGLYAACLQPLIEFFRARIEPDPDLPPVERLRSALRS